MSCKLSDLLRSAVQGLLYPSESDAPLEVVQFPQTPSASTAHALMERLAPGRRVDEIPLDRFFADLAQSDDADRFERLRQLLLKHLQDLHVFRIGSGEVKVDVYILGQADDAWLGLHTVSTET